MKLTVTGKNTVTLGDVLVGEVWLCSGQSNMEWSISISLNPEEEIANANHPLIRQIKVPRVPAAFPQDDINASWQTCTPENVPGWTAVGYFFGRELHKELGVPVGLVNSSWDGTRIEPWVPPVGFYNVDALKYIQDQITAKTPSSEWHKEVLSGYLTQTEEWLAKAKAAMADEAPLDPAPTYPDEIAPFTEHQKPTTLYNGMIHPLVPLAIRGAIWYQGESNHTEGMLYTEKTRAQINGWREVFEQPDLPYYFVQIAPFQYGEEEPSVLPTFWEAQSAILEIPGTGQALCHDIGNLNDIHPKNKQGVGKRLALIALAKTYGRKRVVHSGPTFRDMEIRGNMVRVRFDHTGSGLESRDGKPLNWFEVIGTNTGWVKAGARIAGDAVILSSPKVADPRAIRFGWHKLTEPNLQNAEGLPAVQFRAGEVPKPDFLKVVGEASDYTLALDLDLAKLGPEVTYDVDARADITGGFDRIAYLLELQPETGDATYAYVSMDAFTDDIGKIGVPTIGSGAVFQQTVTGLTVQSNVNGIVQGEGIKTGNIEFWSHSYGPTNGNSVPNASGSVWDFGDIYIDPVDGYGSMQIHNHGAKQTIIAINNWRAGAIADIGIGNSDGDARDWTYKKNGGSYMMKRLRVLVRLAK